MVSDALIQFKNFLSFILGCNPPSLEQESQPKDTSLQERIESQVTNGLSYDARESFLKELGLDPREDPYFASDQADTSVSHEFLEGMMKGIEDRVSKGQEMSYHVPTAGSPIYRTHREDLILSFESIYEAYALLCVTPEYLMAHLVDMEYLVTKREELKPKITDLLKAAAMSVKPQIQSLYQRDQERRSGSGHSTSIN